MKRILASIVGLLASLPAFAGDRFSVTDIAADFDHRTMYLYAGVGYRDTDTGKESSLPIELTYVANSSVYYSLRGTLGNRIEENGTVRSGVGDFSLSATGILIDSKKTFFAIEAGAFLPIGSEAITSDRTDAFLHGRFQYGDGLTRFEGNLTFTWLENSDNLPVEPFSTTASAGIRLDRGGYGRFATDLTATFWDDSRDIVAISGAWSKRFGLRNFFYFMIEKGLSSAYEDWYAEAALEFPLAF